MLLERSALLKPGGKGADYTDISRQVEKSVHGGSECPLAGLLLRLFPDRLIKGFCAMESTPSSLDTQIE